MQILRTSTNPLYLDITWTTLELFFWCLSFQSVWPIIQISSKTIFSIHPDQTENLYILESKNTFCIFAKIPYCLTSTTDAVGIVLSLLSSLAFIPRCAPFHLLPLSFPSSLLHNDQKEGPFFTWRWRTQKTIKRMAKTAPNPKKVSNVTFAQFNYWVLLTFHAAETFHPLLSFYDVI